MHYILLHMLLLLYFAENIITLFILNDLQHTASLCCGPKWRRSCRESEGWHSGVHVFVQSNEEYYLWVRRMYLDQNLNRSIILPCIINVGWDLTVTKAGEPSFLIPFRSLMNMRQYPEKYVLRSKFLRVQINSSQLIREKLDQKNDTKILM